MAVRKSIWVRVVIIAVIGVSLRSAWASITGVSAKNPESLVDCLVSRGMPSDTASRRLLAEADTHAVMRESLPYKRTRDQNLHLLDDICPGWRKKSSYGYGRVNRHPKVSAAEEKIIVATLREKARARGVDEDKFVGTARCESQFYSRAVGDGGLSFGMWQYYKYGHRGSMPVHVALDWRQASDSAAEDFSIEGWKDEYKYKLKWSSKKNRLVKVWYKTGRKVWRSQAWGWTCYRKLYGKTSAMAVAKPDTPKWAISSEVSVATSD